MGLVSAVSSVLQISLDRASGNICNWTLISFFKQELLTMTPQYRRGIALLRLHKPSGRKSRKAPEESSGARKVQNTYV